MPELRTTRDLSQSANVSDARWELQRAASDADYAKWARKWGEAAIDRCGDVEDNDADAADLLAEAEEEAEDYERDLKRLKEAVDVVVDVANDTDGITSFPKLDKAISDLEDVALQCA